MTGEPFSDKLMAVNIPPEFEAELERDAAGYHYLHKRADGSTELTRHPTTEHLRRLLTPNPNLPAPLHSIAVQVQIFSDEILSRLGDGPELSAGLRKLLEAKDCFVRQCLLDVEGPEWEKGKPDV